jgi:hypothetical protein
MEEKPTAHEQRQRWVIKSEHYKIAAEWLEHLGIALIASLVFQKIVAGASLRDPVVILGSDICVNYLCGSSDFAVADINI